MERASVVGATHSFSDAGPADRVHSTIYSERGSAHLPVGEADGRQLLRVVGRRRGWQVRRDARVVQLEQCIERYVQVVRSAGPSRAEREHELERHVPRERTPAARQHTQIQRARVRRLRAGPE